MDPRDWEEEQGLNEEFQKEGFRRNRFSLNKKLDQSPDMEEYLLYEPAMGNALSLQYLHIL